MFSATISGIVKRVIVDNGKADDKAMVKFVLEVKKQFAKKDDMPFIYPLITVFGYDAQYFRDYAGKGHFVEVVNCDMDSWRGEDGDEEERISFKAGKLNLLPKVLADQIEIEDDEEDDRKSRNKKKTSSKGKEERGSGKSRSERRGRRDEDEDEDDEEEEDDEPAPRRKKTGSSGKASSKPSSKAKPSSKDKPGSKTSSKKKSRDDDDDDFYEDDDDLYDDED
jgi:hypothetical protein